MLITANQPFGDWGKIYLDQAMTLASIDRLMHHATILEMNVESYRGAKPSIENAAAADQRHTRQSRNPKK
jgi:DNA replication protein DnaC